MDEFVVNHCEQWVLAGRVPATVHDTEAMVSALLAVYETDPIYYGQQGWPAAWRDLDVCDLVAEGVIEI